MPMSLLPPPALAEDGNGDCEPKLEEANALVGMSSQALHSSSNESVVGAGPLLGRCIGVDAPSGSHALESCIGVRDPSCIGVCGANASCSGVRPPQSSCIGVRKPSLRSGVAQE
eukprot:4740800-Pleurochrysis_carterae.AAC.4